MGYFHPSHSFFLAGTEAKRSDGRPDSDLFVGGTP